MEEVNPEDLSRVMRALGRSRSERKQEAGRANLEKARAVPLTDERRRILSEKQKERRDRERAEKQAAATSPPAEKRKPGRPPKQQVTAQDTGEKRGRGRPPKQAAPPAQPEG